MDEPMASQGQDSEAPQHNGRDESGRRHDEPQRTPLGYTVSQSAASPYAGQGRLLQGGNSQYQHGSPHVPLKPSAKRSATPEHMLNDQVHNVTSFTISFGKLSKSPLNLNVPRWALR